MSTKNNSKWYEFDTIKNFQPMPKRFMVWDKDNHEFLTIRDAYPKCQLSEEERNSATLKLQDLIALFSEYLYYDNSDNYVVCQSTNLFDTRGVEIFEGHLVRWNEDVGVVEQHNGMWAFHIATPAFTVYHELGPNSVMVKVLGHILSNPELMEEEKNV